MGIRVAGRCARSVVTMAIMLFAGLTLVTAGGCQSADSGDVYVPTSVDTSAATDTGQVSAEGEGVLLAKEILATFDELVAQVAVLANSKPEPAVLKPQVEQLYESYVPTMTDLNVRYLALRDSGTMSEFGECNTYLGQYRGQHVVDKDNLLSDALRYYNFELGDQEIVDLISARPIELLEIAVDQS